MSPDARRTARLVAPELEGEPALPPRLAARLAPGPIGLARRRAHQVATKLDALRVGRGALAPAAEARRALLGAGAEAAPRFLLRVDEFPYATSLEHPDRYGLEPSARFHAAFAEAGVPYLMSILPQLPDRPLDPEDHGARPLDAGERALLERMAADGVEFAAHGLTHRTRDARPRHHSELVGLSRAEVGALADASLAALSALGLAPRIFVPPYNRFGAEQYAELAARFAVVGGGPETIGLLGLHPTPRWLGDAVYCPSYAPLYGTARGALEEVERLIAERPGTWVPVTLHLSWELDDGLEGLRRLLDRVAPHAAPWSSFLDAVDASRGDGTV